MQEYPTTQGICEGDKDKNVLNIWDQSISNWNEKNMAMIK